MRDEFPTQFQTGQEAEYVNSLMRFRDIEKQLGATDRIVVLTPENLEKLKIWAQGKQDYLEFLGDEPATGEVAAPPPPAVVVEEPAAKDEYDEAPPPATIVESLIR